MSSGMMWDARCFNRLRACYGWKYMLTCVSTLGGGEGAASGVASGLFTLSGGFGDF